MTCSAASTSACNLNTTFIMPISVELPQCPICQDPLTKSGDQGRPVAPKGCGAFVNFWIQTTRLTLDVYIDIKVMSTAANAPMLISRNSPMHRHLGKLGALVPFVGYLALGTISLSFTLTMAVTIPSFFPLPMAPMMMQPIQEMKTRNCF